MVENNVESNAHYQLGQITASNVSINTSTGVIATTEDKLKLALIQRKETFVGRDSWVPPASVFISILLTLLTADFKKFMLPAAVWEAIFYISLIVSFCWSAYAFFSRPKAQSIDDFIQHIKPPEN